MLNSLLVNEPLSKYIESQAHVYCGYAYISLHDFGVKY